jgi:hypothetical protein
MTIYPSEKLGEPEDARLIGKSITSMKLGELVSEAIASYHESNTERYQAAIDELNRREGRGIYKKDKACCDF